MIRRIRAQVLLTSIGLLVMGVSMAGAEGPGEAVVRADLERYLRGQVEDRSVSIEIPRLAAFTVDRNRHPGRLHTQLSTRAKPPLAGRVPITVALYAGDQLLNRSVVSPYVHRSERVVVTTRNLRRGDIVGPDDLVLASRDVARLSQDVLRDPALATGQRMKSSVRKDQVLRATQIEGVPVVERGDRVMVVLQSGALTIQAIGKTQESGAVGDSIRVLNLDSKRELSGRVDRDGKIHVSF